VLQAAEEPGFKIAPIDWPADIPKTNRTREDRVLAGDVAQLAANVASFDAQIKQKEAEQQRLADMLVAQKTLIDVLQQRVDMRASLVKSGAGPMVTLMDALMTR